MAHPLLQTVRRNYEFRCGYCGVSEIEAGGELTVDHYIPVSAGGGDEEANLVYACFRCNGYKADFVSTESDIAVGIRILHPKEDVFDEHYGLDEDTGELIALTATGTFHIHHLHLNRPQLKIGRVQKLLAQDFIAEMRDLRDENARLLRREQTHGRYGERFGEPE